MHKQGEKIKEKEYVSYILFHTCLKLFTLAPFSLLTNFWLFASHSPKHNKWYRALFGILRLIKSPTARIDDSYAAKKKALRLPSPLVVFCFVGGLLSISTRISSSWPSLSLVVKIHSICLDLAGVDAWAGGQNITDECFPPFVEIMEDDGEYMRPIISEAFLRLPITAVNSANTFFPFSYEAEFLDLLYPAALCSTERLHTATIASSEVVVWSLLSNSVTAPSQGWW